MLHYHLIHFFEPIFDLASHSLDELLETVVDMRKNGSLISGLFGGNIFVAFEFDRFRDHISYCPQVESIFRFHDVFIYPSTDQTVYGEGTVGRSCQEAVAHKLADCKSTLYLRA